MDSPTEGGGRGLSVQEDVSKSQENSREISSGLEAAVLSCRPAQSLRNNLRSRPRVSVAKPMTTPLGKCNSDPPTDTSSVAKVTHPIASVTLFKISQANK